jgi:hypothetical protein
MHNSGKQPAEKAANLFFCNSFNVTEILSDGRTVTHVKLLHTPGPRKRVAAKAKLQVRAIVRAQLRRSV